jgi:serine/threonine-protein kinase
VPRDWNDIVERFTRRHGLDPQVVDVLQRFVDEELTGQTVTIDTQSWASFADQETLRATLREGDDDDAPTPRRLPEETERYIDLGPIGHGGMGEVRRVRDMALNRTMAMKIMREQLVGKPSAEARFIAEAQATAQLQHPGVVPVHDIGRTPDGRWYFTMKELRGQTLHDVLYEALDDPESWPRRRLLELFRSVAEAVAYAHSRGAVHRDLKPANVLVGAFGEVVVLDWGLVKAIGVLDPDDGDAPAMAVDSFATRAGAILGTPSYMAPEQAAGQRDVGPAADLYALGALLYQILSGAPPFEGDAKEVIRQVLEEQPPPLPESTPAVLAELCRHAMQRDPADRPASAQELVEELNRYLDGAARRAKALAIVQEADALQPVVEGHLAHAAALRREALAMGRGTPAWAPLEVKRPIWARQDEADAYQSEADLVGLHRLQLLRAALTESPELEEAHERLAYVYHWCHQRAESVGDAAQATQYRMLLEEYDTGTYRDYLSGEGTLTVHTEPGAEATLHRLVERDRRLHPVEERVLGRTPLREVPLPMGSWVLTLSAPGRAPVTYPVHIARQQSWDDTPPDGMHPVPVPLIPETELGADDCYVPAGWCLLGGDRSAGRPPQRVWVDGFVMRRYQVTNAEFIAFLDDLVENGKEAEASRYLPRTGSGTPCYWQDDTGAHHLGLDDDGDAWQPHHPAVSLTLESARAYAAWEAQRSGLPWRLPWSDEWEKAARGVDGRRYPMGDYLDPTWANVRGCHPDMVLVASARRFPEDASVYGVRGLAGGVLDLCNDRWVADEVEVHQGRAVRHAADHDEFLIGRGGWRTAEVERCRCARITRIAPEMRLDALGFRLVRSVEPAKAPRRGVAFRLTHGR